MVLRSSAARTPRYRRKQRWPWFHQRLAVRVSIILVGSSCVLIVRYRSCDHGLSILDMRTQTPVLVVGMIHGPFYYKFNLLIDFISCFFPLVLTLFTSSGSFFSSSARAFLLILRGIIVNRTKCRYLVKIAKHIGLLVYLRSFLICPPVIVSATTFPAGRHDTVFVFLAFFFVLL